MSYGFIIFLPPPEPCALCIELVSGIEVLYAPALTVRHEETKHSGRRCVCTPWRLSCHVHILSVH